MAICIPLGLARRDEWSYGNDDLLVALNIIYNHLCNLLYNSNSCWLTYEDNFIWAFIVPVLLIMLVSILSTNICTKLHYENSVPNTYRTYRNFGRPNLLIVNYLTKCQLIHNDITM